MALDLTCKRRKSHSLSGSQSTEVKALDLTSPKPVGVEVKLRPAPVLDVRALPSNNDISRYYSHLKLLTSPLDLIQNTKANRSLTRETNSRKNEHEPTPVISDMKSFSGLPEIRSSGIGQEDNRYICKMCHKAYRQVRDYRAHMLTHDDKALFQCDACSRVLYTKEQYITHLKVHGHKEPYSCSHCGHYFRDKCTLHIHIRTHTGEKPFKCDLCGRTFRQSGTYHRHMIIHTEKKPFSCEHCSKSFRHRSTLRLHTFVHTGYAPFSCHICFKTFHQSGHLNKHIASRHSAGRTNDCDKITQGTHY